MPGVELCIAKTYGPTDYQPTTHGGMLWDAASGKAKYALDTSAPTVDIRDAAAAALLAEKHGRSGERYIIANEFISNREFYRIAAELRGNPPLKIIPVGVARVIAATAEGIFKIIGKKDYLLSKDAVFLSGAFKTMDSSKARRELHWNPRPIKETIKDAVEWYARSAEHKS